MKKFTLLLCLFVASVLVPQVVMADDPVTPSITVSNGTLTVRSDAAGWLAAQEKTAAMKACTEIVLIGEFNDNDINSVRLDNSYFNFKVVDMSGVTPLQTSYNYRAYKDSKPDDDGWLGFCAIEGGDLYKSNCSVHTIIPVNLGDSRFWEEISQSNLYEYNISDAINSNVGYYKIKQDKYYHWNGNQWNVLTEEDPIPAINLVSPQNTWSEDDVSSQTNNSTGKDYIVIHGSDYRFYHAYYLNCEWTKVDDDEEYNNNTGRVVIGNCAAVGDLSKEVTNNQYAVVGGTIYKGQRDNNNNFTWVPVSGMSSLDWTVIKFGYWSSSIVTAILPDGVLVDQLFKDNPLDGCGLVVTVQSGATIATITRDGSNSSAVLNVASNSSEFTRMKDILEMNNFVTKGAVTTNIGEQGYNENTKKYTVQGALDCSVINGFEGDLKVLDLKNATGVDKTTLSQLTKATIEYIILPGKKTKGFVCDSTTYYTGESNPKTKNISSLKAVISAEADTVVAHVIEPGSLALGRYYATGGSVSGQSFSLTVTGLKSVILSGNLNASDISTEGSNNGLSGEMHTIESIDLEKAFFPNNNDMHFLNAGFQGGNNDRCYLSKISLPVDPRMKHIPADCFRNIKSLDSLCIPFNYQYIHDGALYDTSIEHLTTTDSIGGTVIDNGLYTYTLSANVLQLGDEPSPKVFAGVPQGTPGEYVFPKENGVTEFYSLATKVPKCYKNAFSYDLTFGYGGQDQSKVYGRDRYFNNGERSKSFVVLRYPSKEVFDRRKAKGKPVENDTTINGVAISGYELMEMKYTDVTKVYTKKDQTGAVDANGNTLVWPSRTEGNRSYNQASAGVLWDDWGKSYTGENGSEINDGDDVALLQRIQNNSRSTVRRFEGAKKYINLRTDTYRPEGVTVSDVDPNADFWGSATFTPSAETQNLFKYVDLSVTHDNVTYNKIVVKFAEPVPSGYMIHAYGGQGDFYNLQGLTQYEIPLTSSPINDFTIFSWWGCSGPIKISEAYFIQEDTSSKRYIDLTQGMSQPEEGSELAEVVVRSQVGTGYSFTPKANVKNMFQYLDMPVSYDNVTYKKIIVKFAEAVPEGFKIHAYGDRGEWTSLKGKTEIEIPLNGNNINDFTIFNWDDSYWTDNGFVNSSDAANPRKITITEAYFTTDDYEEPINTKVKEDLIDYLGWHQIVLTQAAYYEPVEKKEDEKIKRYYEDAGWFTFCIPYDMTYNQVVRMMGIPSSAGNVENYEGETLKTSDVMPDIRQLSGVIRKKGEGNNNNEVHFRLTENLADATNKTAKYLDFKDVEGKWTSSQMSAAKAGETNDGNACCLKGGRPYIIKAYKRVGETIEGRNLGKYIMMRYADELSDTASCVNNGKDYYEQLYTYRLDGDNVVEDKTDALTMRFAKPYEGHKVQAFNCSEDGGQLEYKAKTINGTEETQRYYYTMVGQFWEQDLPQYCVYLTQGQRWKRYTNTNLGFKWDPYKCVIMATPEVISSDYVADTTIVKSLTPDDATQAQIVAEQKENKQKLFTTPSNYTTTFNHFGGGFRDIQNCYFPMNYVGTADWIPAPMILCFVGRDDYYFDNQFVSGTRYIFMMDDEDDIIDYSEDVTAVKTIDVLNGEPQMNGNSKVYSLSGQYMGTTINGLSKGVYIVGGRKVVVD